MRKIYTLFPYGLQHCILWSTAAMDTLEKTLCQQKYIKMYRSIMPLCRLSAILLSQPVAASVHRHHSEAGLLCSL